MRHIGPWIAAAGARVGRRLDAARRGITDIASRLAKRAPAKAEQPAASRQTPRMPAPAPQTPRTPAAAPQTPRTPAAVPQTPRTPAAAPQTPAAARQAPRTPAVPAPRGRGPVAAARGALMRAVAPAPAIDGSLDRALLGWRRIGWGVIVVFMGGSVVWAANTRLDSAAIAQGVIIVESNRKTIQHLEGGIIREILVAEGDRVEANQVLVRFDDTRSRAIEEMVQSRRVEALALQARLVAERDESKEINFPDVLLNQAGNPAVSNVMAAQGDIFKSRRARIANQVSILKERVAQHQREITGLGAQVTSSREQLRLLEEEIKPVKDLYDQGVVSRTLLLSLKRKAADITGDLGDYQAQIARVEKNITEAKLQISTPRDKHLNEVTENLQRVQAELGELQERGQASRDVLTRTAVLAPQSGTVVDLQIHTAGGVVQPGQKLMDLVPDEDRLIVDVRVDPKDIDSIFVGMPAQIRVTAFNARTTPPLKGVVHSVSADRMTDAVTGESYFSARVVPDTKKPALDISALKAGMQAEVFLVTAERTALDYMLEPLARSFARAGREQ